MNSDVQLMYGRIDRDPTVPKTMEKAKKNWWMQVVFRRQKITLPAKRI